MKAHTGASEFTAGLGLPMLNELDKRESNIFRYLAKECRRDVATGVKRNGCRTAGTVSELLVGTALSYFNKTKFSQNCDDLGRLQNWDVTHASGDGDVLNTHKFRLKDGLAVLKKHRNDFVKIGAEFVKGCALRVCPGETGNETNKQLGVVVTFDDCGIRLHVDLSEERRLSPRAAYRCKCSRPNEPVNRRAEGASVLNARLGVACDALRIRQVGDESCVDTAYCFLPLRV